ncbi:hypothetical protein [Glutamicibacter endophyticus]|uniref:hypothetical protein n=1 Tax=Glutamicibacter endophyticus TaxID=1522174 RepID=UPI003AF11BB8
MSHYRDDEMIDLSYGAGGVYLINNTVLLTLELSGDGELMSYEVDTGAGHVIYASDLAPVNDLAFLDGILAYSFSRRDEVVQWWKSNEERDIAVLDKVRGFLGWQVSKIDRSRFPEIWLVFDRATKRRPVGVDWTEVAGVGRMSRYYRLAYSDSLVLQGKFFAGFISASQGIWDEHP